MALDRISNTACLQPSRSSEPKITAGRFLTRSSPFSIEMLELPYCSCFVFPMVKPAKSHNITILLYSFLRESQPNKGPPHFSCHHSEKEPSRMTPDFFSHSGAITVFFFFQ